MENVNSKESGSISVNEAIDRLLPQMEAEANPEVEALYKLAAEQGHEGAAYVLKIGQKIGLKEEAISDDPVIKNYNQARKILLDVVNKSDGIAIEHNQKGIAYQKLPDEEKEKLINQIKICSDYLYYEKWNENFEPFNTGHPSWATSEILLDISYQRLSLFCFSIEF